jgi:ACS family hexuronate transporter-like MFS transporter
MNKSGSFRWIICGLLFFATTVNYLDRAVISLVKEYLDVEFKWTNTDYANITIAFQTAYAVAMIFAGRLIDWLGTKTGYAWSLITWSLAAMSHFLINSNIGFIFARIGLGVTESGNFPAAIKTVSEWFPKKERSFATGIFNAGTNVGAIIAPLSVPFIAATYGWRLTFLIIGATGFVWLIFWSVFYDAPQKSKRLSKAEYDYIHSDRDEQSNEVTADTPQVSWFKLLRYKQTWAYGLGKFLTDGVWWFYLFWLPSFLKEQYGLTKTQLAFPTALVFIIATIGSVYGGWLPLKLISGGMEVFKARKRAMLIYAACALPVLICQWIGGYSLWFAVLMIGFAASAHQAWSANLYTTVSDMFPKYAVASVIGAGGMLGGIGGILVSKVAGALFDYYKGLGHIGTGYFLVFLYCGVAYLLAWTLMHYFVPRMERIDLK